MYVDVLCEMDIFLLSALLPTLSVATPFLVIISVGGCSQSPVQDILCSSRIL